MSPASLVQATAEIISSGTKQPLQIKIMSVDEVWLYVYMTPIIQHRVLLLVWI